MKTFFQITQGILRVGPDTDHETADYDFFTTVLIPGDGTVILFGLDKKDNVRFTPGHRSAMDAWCQEKGVKPFYYRVHNGKVKLMGTKDLPSKAAARNADGSINHETLLQHAGPVLEHFKDGHSKVVNLGHHTNTNAPPPLDNGVTRHYFDVVHGEGVTVPD